MSADQTSDVSSLLWMGPPFWGAFFCVVGPARLFTNKSFFGFLITDTFKLKIQKKMSSLLIG
jgi:hypothetical protein